MLPGLSLITNHRKFLVFKSSFKTQVFQIQTFYYSLNSRFLNIGRVSGTALGSGKIEMDKI